ncbi:type II secretion system secretin GspD [Profundibacter sp.]
MKNLLRLNRIVGFFSICLLVLVSCTSETPSRRSELLANRNNQAGSNAGTQAERFRAALNGRSADRRRMGNDTFLANGNGANRELFEVSDGGEITLNLINVPIAQAAKAVLGDALKKNYTIKPGVEGTVTLQTTRPLSERALLETFQTILELNGASMQTSGKLITIVPISGASRRIGRLGDPQSIGARVVAVPLQYIGTAEMVRLLKPIAGSSVELQPIPKRNILLISGTREEINAAIDAVNLFDVDVLKGKSVGLFKLRAAEPEAVVEELNLIFETGDGGSLQNVVSFIPSKRLGAVLVVSSRSRYLTEAEKWIRDLDKTAGGSTRRPVVYNLQNRSAVDLAPILSEMLQDVAKEDGVAVEGHARVAADDTKNAIIVWGNDTEQENFSRLIQSLDTTPVQVLLEATIAEVSLNDELNFGLRWFFQNGEVSGTFSDASNGAVSSTFPGLSFMFQGASSSAALNALSSVTNVNVISSPSLLVLDNQEARLQIGDQVPIATQQVRDTSNANAPIINTISFKDTGIILTVKPRVSSSGQVVLDIEQEVSSVSTTKTSGIDSPTISQRKIKTSVVISDGQTIALGGLIQDSSNTATSGVPGARKVPILGALFRNRNNTIRKTELLVLITPRVIRNGRESRSITDELRRRISGPNSVINNGISNPSTVHRIID